MKKYLRNIIRSLLNFYLYSSTHIALCAICLTSFTYLTNRYTIDNNYLFFVGFSTLFIYSVHRIIGIQKINEDQIKGRYKIVKAFINHIKVYALVGFIGCIFFYFKLSHYQHISLLLFGAISILYSTPVFRNRRRLRDFAYIKILLIAIVWSFVTESIILLEHGTDYDVVGMAFLERCLYFIGITIPFDIRDLRVDRSSSVRTLPQLLGVRYAIMLALLLLTMTLLISYLTRRDIALIICYGSSILLVLCSTKTRDDFMYSGLLDGTMLIPFLYICLS